MAWEVLLDFLKVGTVTYSWNYPEVYVEDAGEDVLRGNIESNA